MKKPFRKPYRVKKKKSIFRNRFFWLTILGLIATTGIFYLFFFHSFFQIKEIKISGNLKVETSDLENLLREKITQRFLFFQTESIFLVNSKEIIKNILEKFPQILKINLVKKFPHTLLIQVEERKPIAIFCQGENCFFIDKEGIIFEKTANLNNYLMLKSQIQNPSLNLGERAIEKELLFSILEIESKLKEDFKIPIKEFSIVSEDRINVKTAEGWEIYFNPQKDINWQLTKLKAVLEESIPLEKRKNLEYIELRFGNFAPYKYRD